MDVLLENDIYSQFAKEDFDVNVFASQSIQTGLAIADQLTRLSDGISALDKELRQQVSLRYEDLLSQVTSVETLEEVLKTMHLRIQSLLSAVERLRIKVVEPYQKISDLTSTLSRLQSACDLLRSVVRVSYLTRRLRTQLQGGSKEITKCAQTLNELSYVTEAVDLNGIEIVAKDQKLIRQARKDVELQAKQMLNQGIELQNQTEVATALQVFYNLGILSDVVSNVISDAKRRLEDDVREALDVRSLSSVGSISGDARGGGPGRAAIPAVGNAALFRANLWTNVEKLMSQIYNSCSRVQHLQKVLSKKRDPVSHVPFVKAMASESGDRDVTASFWNDVTNVLTKELVRAANESTFIKQAFEGEFPKLLRLYSDLWRRLQQFSSNLNDSGSAGFSVHVSVDGTLDELGGSQFDPEGALRASLSPFKNAYHSRSLSRLFDPINVMFSPGSASPPTSEEVEAVLTTILAELNVSSVDHELAITVAKNVANTIQLFVVKCEEMLSTDDEAHQVIGPPTPSQTNNAAIVDLLDLFHYRIKSVLKEVNANFPIKAAEMIKTAAKSFRTQMSAAIQPLLSSIEGAIEAIILTMHDEDFSISTPDISQNAAQLSPCSLYMKELHDFIARVQADYFSQFKCRDFIADSIKPIACRAIELFIRLVCLVRPLGEGGKRKLAADCAQMEMCLLPLCPQIAELGRHYRMLRAIRPLLFQTPEHAAKSTALGETFSYSTVLHLLFSKGPSELLSPHQTVQWSVSDYSKWLDKHPSESDRLELIRGALEAYVGSVRRKQAKEFAPIYPVLLQLLQTALQNA